MVMSYFAKKWGKGARPTTIPEYYILGQLKSMKLNVIRGQTFHDARIEKCSFIQL